MSVIDTANMARGRTDSWYSVAIMRTMGVQIIDWKQPFRHQSISSSA